MLKALARMDIKIKEALNYVIVRSWRGYTMQLVIKTNKRVTCGKSKYMHYIPLIQNRYPLHMGTAHYRFCRTHRCKPHCPNFLSLELFFN